MHFRWNSENLPPVKYNDIEEMISMVLDDSALRLENKTFDRITEPVQPWDSDRLNKVGSRFYFLHKN